MDDNLISYTGDAEGRIWRNGILLYDVPAPAAAHVMRTAEERDLPALLAAAEAAGRNIADVLKFSGVRDLHVMVHGIVPGGREDCVDVNNRCRYVCVDAPGGYAPRGRYVSTIKGESRMIVIAGPVLNRARVVEHDLGNWSDQDQDISSDITLDTPPAPGVGAVRYRRLNATEPQLLVDGLTAPPGTYRRAFRLRGFFRAWFIAIFKLIKRLS